MDLPSILVISIIICGFMYVAIGLLYSAIKKSGAKRWLECLASVLLIVGAVGFFGSGLSAIGGLNWLPGSFEWPVGNASGVITVSNFFVVPHTPSGRVQVYGRDWKFVRGWHVDAGGGTFKLKMPDQYHIAVITARGQWHYVFDLNGKLLSKEKYSPASYSAFQGEGQSYVVPTPPWLWVFSSPFYSWLLIALGIGL